MIGDLLERSYAELDALPATLFPPVVAHPVGTLRVRARAVNAWRTALLHGQLPAAQVWPSEALHRVLCGAVEHMGILRFSSGQPELVDLVLQDLLRQVARLAAEHEHRIAEHLAALRTKARQEWELPSEPVAATGGGTSTDVENSRTGESRAGGDDDGSGGWVGRQEGGEAPGEAKARAMDAQRLAAASVRLAEEETLQALSERLDATWAPRVAAWRRLADVLGDLRHALALGFDLENRVLRHVGWEALTSLQRILDQTPQLRALIHTLGRMNQPRGEERASVLDEVVSPVRRVVEERRIVRSRRVPTEARGIERSGDISRMLPTEAALLVHPTLRLLWHARRVESALATYRYEGQVEEVVRIQKESAPTERSSHRVPERGPVVICLDTSGSMQGAPEQIAKALVLAVARAAHEEGRLCKVVLFSGPAHVESREVDFGPKGLDALLGLLSMSFHGGTDVDWPLRVALDTLEEEGWDRADLLIVSDGAFEVPSGMVEQIHMARERHQARTHGLVIGVQGSEAMEQLCDPVHLFADWAAVGGFDGREGG